MKLESLERDKDDLEEYRPKIRQFGPKRKKHRKGFHEDIQKSRHDRLNFKNYLKQVEDELAEDEINNIGDSL